MLATIYGRIVRTPSRRVQEYKTFQYGVLQPNLEPDLIARLDGPLHNSLVLLY